MDSSDVFAPRGAGSGDATAADDMSCAIMVEKAWLELYLLVDSLLDMPA
ncbi:MAG: hypothetical protein P4L43_02435 [Syntrophobacteraceae bacterium]|nr:hypothetical protein [Syntrophobacteraceae bacterium]